MGCLRLSRVSRGGYASNTICFKLEAVEYALKNDKHRSRRHFSIDEVCNRYWRRQHEKLFSPDTIWHPVQHVAYNHSGHMGYVFKRVSIVYHHCHMATFDCDSLPLAVCKEELIMTEKFNLNQSAPYDIPISSPQIQHPSLYALQASYLHQEV